MINPFCSVMSQKNKTKFKYPLYNFKFLDFFKSITYINWEKLFLLLLLFFQLGFAYISFETEKDRNIALNKHRGFLGE